MILCAQLRPRPLDEPFGQALQYAERRGINCGRRGVLYIDSFAGNLYCSFIILWFIGGGCNEKN